MRVVFMGTPEFAVPSLRALSTRFDVVAAYTRPDSASGRGSRLRPTPVRIAAEELGIPVCTPSGLRSADEADSVRQADPDVIVVVAYGVILPRNVLDIPRLGAINVHASLLPRWRGAAPVQRAILAGDERAGVSIMRMEAGLDTGPYCAQLSTPVADKDAASLTAELASLGAHALLDALPAIADHSVRWTEQDPDKATYAEKVGRLDVLVAPQLASADAVRRVRASLSSAPARAVLGGRSVTLLAAQPAQMAVPAGTLAVVKSAVVLGMSDGAVAVTRLKPDGKAAMDADAWARGIPDLDGSHWQAAS